MIATLVVRPEHLARLYEELQPTPAAPFPNIVIYSKAGQVADCWRFGDAKLMQKYLSDELSEDDLKRIAAGDPP